MSSVRRWVVGGLAAIIANIAFAADPSTLYLYDRRGNVVGVTDPSVDPTNCGGADFVCSSNHVIPACSGGTCSGSCSENWGDCDSNKLSNGCETDLTTDSNCGGCGLYCGTYHRSASKCVLMHTRPIPGQPQDPGAGWYGCDGRCEPGWQDCDGDSRNGCEARLGTLNQCEFCGAACPAPPNFIPACIPPTPDNQQWGYKCGGSCTPGRGDCDNDLANGCETDITTTSNCGGCGLACSVNHVEGSACSSSGSCKGTCAVGFGNCDGNLQANGCETSLTTTIDCGVCGYECPTDPNGSPVCNVTQHSSGIAASCGFLCNSGYTYQSATTGYGGVVTSPATCFPCPGVANGYAVSSNNVCSLVCNPGYGLKGTTSTGYGGVLTTTYSCIDIASDPANCGAVGYTCANTAHGYGTCSGGVCGIACNSGYGLLNGSCISTTSDPKNCGAVGIVCPGTANGYGTCANSACGLACNAGYGLSGASCINIASDPRNCGAVGAVCPGTTNGFGTCSNGACGLGCNPGYGLKATTTTGYGGVSSTTYSCIDIATDPSNCGAVGFTCSGTANGYGTCSGGVCGLACNSGASWCGNTCKYLALDVDNCGTCGHACTVSGTAGKKCNAGTCQACNSGYGGIITCVNQ